MVAMACRYQRGYPRRQLDERAFYQQADERDPPDWAEQREK